MLRHRIRKQHDCRREQLILTSTHQGNGISFLPSAATYPQNKLQEWAPHSEAGGPGAVRGWTCLAPAGLQKAPARLRDGTSATSWIKRPQELHPSTWSRVPWDMKRRQHQSVGSLGGRAVTPDSAGIGGGRAGFCPCSTPGGKKPSLQPVFPSVKVGGFEQMILFYDNHITPCGPTILS